MLPRVQCYASKHVSLSSYNVPSTFQRRQSLRVSSFFSEFPQSYGERGASAPKIRPSQSSEEINATLILDFSSSCCGARQAPSKTESTKCGKLSLVVTGARVICRDNGRREVSH